MAATHERQLCLATSELEEISAQRDRTVESNQALQLRVDQLEHELAQVADRLTQAADRETKFQDAVALAQREADSKKAKVAQHAAEIESLHQARQAQSAELSNQLAEQRAEIDRLTQRVEEGSRAKAELTAARAELQKERDRFAEEMRQSQESHQQKLATQVKASKSSLVSANLELSHFQRREADTAKELNSLRQRLAAAEQRGLEATAAAEQAAERQREITGLRQAARDQAIEHQRIVQSLTPNAQAIDSQCQSTINLLRAELRQQEQRLMTEESVNQELRDQLKEIANPATPPPFANADAEKLPTARKRAGKKAATESLKLKKVTAIKGIGPVAKKRLQQLGIETVQQIAAWTKEDIQHVESKLNCAGRVKREQWVEQAKNLIKPS